MKLFITGATGFIGRYLLDLALKENHEIVALTRSETNRNRIVHENLKWLKKDLRLVNSRDLEGSEIVINLASVGISPRKATLDDLININITGAVKLMENSIKANIKRVLFIGSCHEYGTSADDYQYIPVDAALRPITKYASSKVAAFNLMCNLCRSTKIEFIYQRIFSAFGMGQHKDNFWPSLREAAITGKDFKMTDGNQIRDFIPVEDVAFHILNACKRKDVENGIPFVMNVGSGKSLTLYDFAKNEWNKFNASGQIKKGIISNRENEPLRMVPNLQNLFT